MKKKKYFGTDGIRGSVGGEVITPEFILKLGASLGHVLREKMGVTRPKVLIGKDTRVSGYLFESALEAGLVSAGVDIHMLGPMPTPGVAYLTRTLRAQAGIVISASHNPYYDNGIKFFSSDGFKIPDEYEFAIEALIDEPKQMVVSHKLGKANRVDDAQGRYIEYCKGTVDPEHSFSDIKVVLDCAHGATYDVAPHVFSELGFQVEVIGNKPDGFNINDEYGSTAPEKLIQRVLDSKADFGVAFDGDGDRVIMVDNKGRIIDGDEIIYMIAQDRHARGIWKGGVVGTLMSNFGLEKALTELNIPFERAQVGDRYVIEALRNSNWILGGESSGHIICMNKTTTGDGIIGALQAISAMMYQGKDLATLKDNLKLMPQEKQNVPVSGNAAKIIESVQSVIDGEGQRLSGQGRVLVRPSGTEPLIRVMAEGEDTEMLKESVSSIVSAIKESCH
jgi:phosphoglucosamine mutase